MVNNQNPLQPTVEVCLSPALAEFISTGDDAIVVVVDILRATTSMVSALANGAKSVIPVSSLDEARQLKKQGFPVAAERDGSILDFADFGNSAFDFQNGTVKGKKLVFSTTNGTVAIETSKKSGTVVIGAFSNISALAGWINNQHKPVIILCSGWKNTFCLEDTIFGGALIEKLTEKGNFAIHTDASHAALDLWNLAKRDLPGYIEKASHRERLRQLGVDDVLEFSFTPDTTGVVPVLIENDLVDVIKIHNENQSR